MAQQLFRVITTYSQSLGKSFHTIMLDKKKALCLSEKLHMVYLQLLGKSSDLLLWPPKCAAGKCSASAVAL